MSTTSTPMIRSWIPTSAPRPMGPGTPFCNSIRNRQPGSRANAKYGGDPATPGHAGGAEGGADRPGLPAVLSGHTLHHGLDRPRPGRSPDLVAAPAHRPDLYPVLSQLGPAPSRDRDRPLSRHPQLPQRRGQYRLHGHAVPHHPPPLSPHPPDAGPRRPIGR